MSLAPTVELANGVKMPGLGLGTWPMDDAGAEATIAEALGVGYRLFDSAENYRNEVGVGRGVRSVDIDRDEIFVTSKFNREWHSVEGAREAWTNSTKLMGLSMIDVLLIHWPNPEQNTYVDAWHGMIDLLEEGKVRAIGVSNFKPKHIARLIDETGVAPQMNQIQLNPRIGREAERAYHAEHGIVTECWSPIGQGSELLGEPPIVAAAEAHGRSPAQIVLRWHVQLGQVPIPKTEKTSRLRENLAVFDFELSDAELDAISSLDRGGEGAVDSDLTGH